MRLLGISSGDHLITETITIKDLILIDLHVIGQFIVRSIFQRVNIEQDIYEDGLK